MLEDTFTIVIRHTHYLNYTLMKKFILSIALVSISVICLCLVHLDNLSDLNLDDDKKGVIKNSDDNVIDVNISEGKTTSELIINE